MTENNKMDASKPRLYTEAELRAAIEGMDGCVVVCIGHTGCGKTSVVQSLIAYMNLIGKVDLGDGLNDKAKVAFLNNAIYSFVRFEAPVQATGDPFFASFTFSPNSPKHMPVHMSFIDVRGEAYESFVDDRGGIVKPENLEPYIKAAFSSNKAIVWLFVASPDNILFENVREGNVLSSFLHQFEHFRTKEYLKKDRVILLISKADQHARDTLHENVERLYAEPIGLFENRHKAIFRRIAYSTGGWNDKRVPTSLNTEKARELTNYLYKLVAKYDLPEEEASWYSKAWDWLKKHYRWPLALISAIRALFIK